MSGDTTVLISSVQVATFNNIVTIHKTNALRSTCSFTVVDSTGTANYTKRQPVLVTDSVIGLRFAGYIHTVTRNNLNPNTTNMISIDCVDRSDIADNVYVRKDYENQYAGDIASDLLNTYLAGEGVSANYAIRRDSSKTQFSLGTLTNSVGASNVGDGNLELAPAGTSVEIKESTTADFSTGTLTNVTAASNTLAPSSIQLIKFSGTMNTSGLNNASATYKIWSGSYTLLSTDTSLRWYTWIDPANPEIKATIDLTFSDGSTLLGSNPFNDFFQIEPQASADLSGFANGQWYSRTVTITNVTGKTVVGANVILGGVKGGNYTAYFRRMVVTQNVATTVTLTLFDTSLAMAQELQTIGYTNLSCTQVTGYNLPIARIGSTIAPDPSTVGFMGLRTIPHERISTAYDISAAALLRNSFISWLASGSIVSIKYSLNGGAPIECTNNAPLPGLLPGMNLAGCTLTLHEEFYISSDGKPTDLPLLNSVEVTINPSFSCTKTDVLYSTAFSGSEPGATFSNTVQGATANFLALSGVSRSWDDADNLNQTYYLATGAAAGENRGSQTFFNFDDTMTESKIRFDFAPQLQNFTSDIDIQVTDDNLELAGLLYRCTNFSTSAGSYAYAVFISQTGVILKRGTNTTGGGSVTTVTSVALTLQANSWHHITAIINGTNHQIFLDGVRIINATSTNFNAAGYFGLIALTTNSTATVFSTAWFDNFGAMPVLTGTWISPSIALSSVGTYFDSYIYWRNRSASSSSNVVNVQYSINGGSTYVDCINSSALPGLVAGQSFSGVSLKIKITLTTNTSARIPAIDYPQLLIIGAYSSIGDRLSPALSLNNVGIAGDTLASWNGIQPAGTTISLYTSPVGYASLSLVGSGASGSGTIASVVTQPDAIDDTFDVDTSANYTNTAKSGGTSTSWPISTSNSRVNVSGGVNAQLLNTATSTQDVKLIVDTDYSDGGGLLWRWANNANYYKLDIFDSASNQGLQNKLRLVKVVSNASTTLQTYSVTLTRGIVYRIMLTMVGSTINIYIDGALVATTVDTSITATGKCGLSNIAGNAEFYRLYTQPIGTSQIGNNVYSYIYLTTTDPRYTPQVTDITLSVRAPGVQSGALIPQASYSIMSGNKTTVAGAFDDLAKKSTNFIWSIDDNFNYSFGEKHAMLTPWVISRNDIQSNTQITVETSGDQYENTHIANGGIDVISVSDIKQGDGLTQTWPLAYPIESIDSISINNVPASYGARDSTTGKDFNFKSGELSFSQNSANLPLLPGQFVTINYQGQTSVVVELRKDDQIAIMSSLDHTNGIVEAIENVNGLGKIAMLQLCQSRLDQFAIISLIASFTTTRDGLDAGQVGSLFLDQYQIKDAQFILTDVTTNIDSINVEYTVKGTTGPDLGDWVSKSINRIKGLV